MRTTDAATYLFLAALAGEHVGGDRLVHLGGAAQHNAASTIGRLHLNDLATGPHADVVQLPATAEQETGQYKRERADDADSPKAANSTWVNSCSPGSTMSVNSTS